MEQCGLRGATRPDAIAQRALTGRLHLTGQRGLRKAATLLWATYVALSFAPSHAQVSTSASGGVSPSGAFTYSIPIRIPPGTAGVQPSLALSYSSQAGNGIAGVGWNLSGLSVITRCAATEATDGKRGGVNLDGNDKLCLDGQRLIVQSGTYGQPGATYYTEIFNGSRITQKGTSSPLVWRAPSPDFQQPVLSYAGATNTTTTTQLFKSGAAADKTAYGTTSNGVEFWVETKAGELMEYARADLAGGA